MAGKIRLMDFVATFSYLRTMLQLFYPLKGPPFKALRPRRISSTIICCSLAAALEWIFRGYFGRSVTAMHVIGGAMILV
jgi:hypothetical protein